MDIRLIAGRDLSPDVVRAWTELQLGNPELASPYFTPEFTQVMAEVRDDVEVAVIRDGGRIVALLPFQRSGASLGRPVGGSLSDYHGLVCEPEFECDPRALIKACRLAAWDFDHLLASQRSFAPYHRHLEGSPQIDLSAGYDAYVSRRRAAGSEQIKKTGNLVRRLEREIGPVEFVAHSTDRAMLDQTLAWKSRQYVASGKPDIFAERWVRSAMERFQLAPAGTCTGILSLVSAGGQLVAGHFGMRSRTVWHYWFPAYDPAMAKYSPGLILLLQMAKHASSLGLKTLDLGKGMSLYKERLMTGSVMVASGSVELPSLLSLGRAAERRLRALVASSVLAGPARRLVRRVRAGSLGGKRS